MFTLTDCIWQLPHVRTVHGRLHVCSLQAGRDVGKTITRYYRRCRECQENATSSTVMMTPGWSKFVPSRETKCDMIKRNESDVGDVVFEILAKTGFEFLCFILFLA